MKPRQAATGRHGSETDGFAFGGQPALVLIGFVFVAWWRFYPPRWEIRACSILQAIRAFHDRAFSNSWLIVRVQCAHLFRPCSSGLIRGAVAKTPGLP